MVRRIWLIRMVSLLLVGVFVSAVIPSAQAAGCSQLTYHFNHAYPNPYVRTDGRSLGASITFYGVDTALQPLTATLSMDIQNARGDFIGRATAGPIRSSFDIQGIIMLEPPIFLQPGIYGLFFTLDAGDCGTRSNRFQLLIL